MVRRHARIALGETKQIGISRLLPVLLAVCALHAAPPGANGGLDPQRLKMVPERMKGFVDRGEVAGVVTLVARHGQVAQLEAAGYQDIENKKPMRTDSIFQIMSMTKPVTGVAVMMLAEEGKLSLMDPVERLLPSFRGQMVATKNDDGAKTLRKPARPIRIADLMSHTSGMTGPLPAPFADLYQKMNLKLADAVALFSQQPLDFDPGTKWAYSNMGIATLGRLIEVASDQPYEQFIQERILKPLGMKDSSFYLPADKADRLAVLYIYRDGKLERSGGDALGGDSTQMRKGAVYPAPEFGLYSTASDLAAFYQMMLNGGTSNHKRFLSSSSVDVMTSLQTGALQAGHNPGTGFGLTWEVVKDPTGEATLLSEGTFKHGGAFGTHGWVDRKKDIVGVYLIQRQNDDQAGRNAFMQIVGSSMID